MVKLLSGAGQCTDAMINLREHTEGLKSVSEDSVGPCPVKREEARS